MRQGVPREGEVGAGQAAAWDQAADPEHDPRLQSRHSLAPLLLPAYNTLFDLTFRVSLPSLPERFVDWFTVVLLGAGGFFPLRRLLIPRVRALTTARDWLVLALVMAPFVIAAIPFTAIGHMPFILFARFFTSGE